MSCLDSSGFVIWNLWEIGVELASFGIFKHSVRLLLLDEELGLVDLVYVRLNEIHLYASAQPVGSIIGKLIEFWGDNLR
ncbi:hypothetical protein CHUAL_011288 [Chamberlinius hualienensis]